MINKLSIIAFVLMILVAGLYMFWRWVLTLNVEAQFFFFLASLFGVLAIIRFFQTPLK